MKWFKNPATLEELKNQYRNLAMQHHPDRGGTTADMQEINAEYDRLFARLKNTHKAADGTTIIYICSFFISFLLNKCCLRTYR